MVSGLDWEVKRHVPTFTKYFAVHFPNKHIWISDLNYFEKTSEYPELKTGSLCSNHAQALNVNTIKITY